MSRPSLIQAQAWHPEALRRLADRWDELARLVHDRASIAARSTPEWTGAGGDAARSHAEAVASAADALARSLVLAAVAARDGAGQIAVAQSEVTAAVADARADGFTVAEDGVVGPRGDAPPLVLALAGGDAGVAAGMLGARAAALTGRIGHALDRLGAADAHTAQDLRDAFAAVDRAADPAAGNTDGVAWDTRIAANRTTIAQSIVEHLGEPGATDRNAFYRSLLGEIDDPAGSGQRVDRQILAFDPARDTLVELNGDLATARSVAVLIPGMNTSILGSADTTDTARAFVSATRGEVAAITYLGGAFPRGDNVVAALAEAARPRLAIAMAPRLVAFSRDVDATVDATGRSIPVTYVGHSYGGAILGTAEALGLTADRTLYAAAAGAGFGVDTAADWHDRNPHVLRFSMTAPGDPIQLVQGLPGSPHGADPDEMAGVIHLATGRYDDGRLMAGPASHTDLLSVPASDSWRNVLAVITGDRDHIRLAG